jgi:hypothetical protein
LEKKRVCIGDVITFLDSRVARGLFVADFTSLAAGMRIHSLAFAATVATAPATITGDVQMIEVGGMRSVSRLRRGVPAAANLSLG